MPGLRTMTPPGGVFVATEMPYCFIAAELSTAPCSETWPTITGLSGKAASRSSRFSVRSGMTLSS